MSEARAISLPSNVRKTAIAPQGIERYAVPQCMEPYKNLCLVVTDYLRMNRGASILHLIKCMAILSRGGHFKACSLLLYFQGLVMCFNYSYRSRKMSRLRCRHRHALFVFIYIIFSRKSNIKLDLNVSCCLILSKTAFLSQVTVVFGAGSEDNQRQP